MRLAPSEKVIFSTRRHWIILMPALGLTLVGLCCGLCTIAGSMGEPPPGQPPPPAEMFYCLAACVGLIFLAAAVVIIRAIFDFANSSYILTNQRIIATTGFPKRTLEILLPNVDSVQTQNISSLFGYGSLVIMSTRSNQVLKYVDQAETFYQHLREQQYR